MFGNVTNLEANLENCFSKTIIGSLSFCGPLIHSHL